MGFPDEMKRYSPEIYDVARRLLAYEAGGHPDPAGMADAMERICQRMYQQLVKRVGSTGYSVLVARALHVTKDEFLFLDSVEVELQSGSCLKGLREGVQELDSTEVGQGIASLLANFISLLSRFVGPDLALSQVHRAYPEIPLDEAGHSSEEAKE